MSAQLAMKSEAAITVYGQLGNHAVVRLPGRRYPGLLLQADTVAGFIAQLDAARSCLRGGRLQRAEAELHMAVEMLEQWHALIVQRLAEAGERLD